MPNYDHMVIGGIGAIRRDIQETERRKKRLEHVIERYDHRISASVSAGYRRTLRDRQQRAKGELSLLAMELADLRLMFKNYCTEAKLRGLITDSDILRWQREDFNAI